MLSRLVGTSGGRHHMHCIQGARAILFLVLPQRSKVPQIDSRSAGSYCEIKCVLLSGQICPSPTEAVVQIRDSPDESASDATSAHHPSTENTQTTRMNEQRLHQSIASKRAIDFTICFFSAELIEEIFLNARDTLLPPVVRLASFRTNHARPACYFQRLEEHV